MALQFGEFPLQLFLGDEEGTYKVSSQYAADADLCGINQVFPADRLAIMQARGLAFGYKVEVVDAVQDVSTAQKKVNP